MESKKTIDLGSMKVSFVEKVTYDSLDVDSFKEKFRELLNKGYIIADTFESNFWRLVDKIDEEYKNVEFDLGLYPEINLALKGFVVMARENGLSPVHTKKMHKIVKDLAWVSQGFKSMEGFTRYLNKVEGKIYFNDVVAAIKTFTNFYPFPLKEVLLEKVSSYEKVDSAIRELPRFRDVFLFEDIMNDYSQRNNDQYLKLKYYPIELWWYITNIIPMRPIEFTLIRMNCLDPKKDGSYWITIPRVKQKSDNPEQEYWEQTIQIDENLYRFIREYIFVLETLGIEGEYLLPQELYQKTHIKKKNNFSRINRHQFTKLLESFYKEVVEEKYKQVGMDQITPGDTRHFAIMNMFFQGFNMLSIARMAGHARIDQPSHYYSHIPELSSSFAYHLANTRPYEISINKILPGGFLSFRSKARDRGQQYKYLDTSKLLRVDYGFCEDKDGFPSNCAEDCRPCPFYAFLPSVNEEQEGLKWLEDFSSQIEQKMKEQIDYMNALFTSHSKEKIKYNENEVKWASKKLQQYMDHKVMVDLKILRGYYENGTENYQKNTDAI
jgi:integrase